MNKIIFQKWFEEKFVPQVQNYLSSQGLPEKACLVLDNALSHPSEMLLKSNDGQIFIKYLSPNVTALIQPMDQGIIACTKQNYKTSVLKKSLKRGTI